MCGIVGYIGKQKALPILINGLKRLEYRGYDSAGIAMLENGDLQIVKQPGKICELEESVAAANFTGNVGIGHTRWATHGVPDRKNAHPHTDCRKRLAIIHNGIIENYSTLKNELILKGHTFVSETDTEILVHLIEEFYDNNLEQAVRYALAEIQGTYGILVVSKDEPEMIVAARNGSPLLIGVGEEEYFAASDASAIIRHTRDVAYLDDGEMAILNHKTFVTKTIHDKPVTKYVERVSFDLEQIEKGGYPHFMLKEIFNQPETIRDCMRGRLMLENGDVRLGGLEVQDRKSVV